MVFLRAILKVHTANAIRNILQILPYHSFGKKSILLRFWWECDEKIIHGRMVISCCAIT